MNLRDIKKDIEYVIGAFIDDCTMFGALHPEANTDDLEKLLNEAINLYNDLRDRVNSKAEKRNAAYFRAIRKDLLEKTNDLYEKLSSLVKSTKESEPATK